MARVPIITDEQILISAREVFLEQGFNVATTDIASRAGISSGSIFKRFATKEDLFFAAMRYESSWAKGLDSLVGQGDLKANLEVIAKAILDFSTEMLPCSMLSWSLCDVAASNQGQELAAARDTRLLAEFLEKERDLGRFRPSLDTQVAASTILGTMMNYAMLELFSGNQRINSKNFIEAFIDTFWKGLIANPDSL
jgi:AcrR family transcriptional regulator